MTDKPLLTMKTGTSLFLAKTDEEATKFTETRSRQIDLVLRTRFPSFFVSRLHCTGPDMDFWHVWIGPANESGFLSGKTTFIVER